MEKYQITPETPTLCFAAHRVVLAAGALEIFHLCDQTMPKKRRRKKTKTIPLWTQKCQRFQFRLLLLEGRTFVLGIALETFLTFACKIIFTFSSLQQRPSSLQQTPFSTPSHFISIKCEANCSHSGVREVKASRFACCSWKAGHSALCLQ